MPLLENLMQCIVAGYRSLVKRPAVLLFTTISLGFSIGPNIAVFSLIDALHLRALPVKEPNRLLLLTDPTVHGVFNGTQSGVRTVLSFHEYEQIRDQQNVLDSICASESSTELVMASLDKHSSEPVRIRLVSGSYFTVFEVAPAIGRAFSDGEVNIPHGAPLAVLSHSYWNRRFGQDKSVLGRVIQVGAASFSIIGVMPARFFGETVGEAPDIWIPITVQPDLKPGRDWLRNDPKQESQVMWLQVFGRVRSGIDLATAASGLNVTFAGVLERYKGLSVSKERREKLMDQRLDVRPGARGANQLTKRFFQPLLVLLALAASVLVLACSNIAGILLVRWDQRRHEIALRLALGISRRRLTAELCVEGIIIALLGGAAGLIMAQWAIRLLLRLASNTTDPVPLLTNTDGPVILFTIGVTLLTGIVLGGLPSVQACRTDVATALRKGERRSGSGRPSVANLLIGTQLAITMVLLIGAEQFVGSLSSLERVDLGFPSRNLLLFDVDGVANGQSSARLTEFYAALLDSLRTTPGVQSATFSRNGLFSGADSGTQLSAEGYSGHTRFDNVGPNYFSVLGVPLIRGRDISVADSQNSSPVCVINATMARELFQGRDAIGKHIKEQSAGRALEIVGVAQDARDHSLTADIPRRFYVPAAQGLPRVPESVIYEVRTSVDAESLTPAIRQRAATVASSLKTSSYTTLAALLHRKLAQERTMATTASFFGLLALLLSLLGIYGVLSYHVMRQTREIGVRLALGASRRSIIALILRRTVLILTFGIPIGSVAGVVLGRIISSRIPGIGATDTNSVLFAVILIANSSLLASFVPAARAAYADPSNALRVE